MELLEAAQDGVSVVHVVGRVNSANSQEMGVRLRAILDHGGKAIVLDLSRLDHMTSAGFRSLLIADGQAGEDALGAHFVLVRTARIDAGALRDRRLSSTCSWLRRRETKRSVERRQLRLEA